MKSKRFTEEQIIRILHVTEAGVTVADICRKHNSSEQSLFHWKAKFGGMDVSETKRLREQARARGRRTEEDGGRTGAQYLHAEGHQ